MKRKLPENVRKELRLLRRKWKKAVALRFYKGPRLYTLFLVTNNPKVDLQAALCYYLNLAQFRRPPRTKMLITVAKPLPWPRLQPGYYVKSERELKATLKRGWHPKAWRKERREPPKKEGRERSYRKGK